MELLVQTAVSVRVPLLHDLPPDRVYPLSQVGVHVAPSARVEVQSPLAPFEGAPDASHVLLEPLSLPEGLGAGADAPLGGGGDGDGGGAATPSVMSGVNFPPDGTVTLVAPDAFILSMNAVASLNTLLVMLAAMSVSSATLTSATVNEIFTS